MLVASRATAKTIPLTGDNWAASIASLPGAGEQATDPCAREFYGASPGVDRAVDPAESRDGPPRRVPSHHHHHGDTPAAQRPACLAPAAHTISQHGLRMHAQHMQ